MTFVLFYRKRQSAPPLLSLLYLFEKRATGLVYKLISPGLSVVIGSTLAG